MSLSKEARLTMGVYPRHAFHASKDDKAYQLEFLSFLRHRQARLNIRMETDDAAFQIFKSSLGDGMRKETADIISMVRASEPLEFPNAEIELRWREVIMQETFTRSRTTYPIQIPIDLGVDREMDRIELKRHVPSIIIDNDYANMEEVLEALLDYASRKRFSHNDIRRALSFLITDPRMYEIFAQMHRCSIPATFAQLCAMYQRMASITDIQGNIRNFRRKRTENLEDAFIRFCQFITANTHKFHPFMITDQIAYCHEIGLMHLAKAAARVPIAAHQKIVRLNGWHFDVSLCLRLAFQTERDEQLWCRNPLLGVPPSDSESEDDIPPNYSQLDAFKRRKPLSEYGDSSGRAEGPDERKEGGYAVERIFHLSNLHLSNSDEEENGGRQADIHINLLTIEDSSGSYCPICRLKYGPNVAHSEADCPDNPQSLIRRCERCDTDHDGRCQQRLHDDGQVDCAVCHLNGHLAQDCPSRRVPGTSPVEQLSMEVEELTLHPTHICRICGLEGHNHNRCWQNSEAPMRQCRICGNRHAGRCLVAPLEAQTTCTLCKSSEHLLDICPRNPMASYRACRFCRKRHHGRCMAIRRADVFKCTTCKNNAHDTDDCPLITPRLFDRYSPIRHLCPFCYINMEEHTHEPHLCPDFPDAGYRFCTRCRTKHVGMCGTRDPTIKPPLYCKFCAGLDHMVTTCPLWHKRRDGSLQYSLYCTRCQEGGHTHYGCPRNAETLAQAQQRWDDQQRQQRLQRCQVCTSRLHPTHDCPEHPEPPGLGRIRAENRGIVGRHQRASYISISEPDQISEIDRMRLLSRTSPPLTIPEMVAREEKEEAQARNGMTGGYLCPLPGESQEDFYRRREQSGRCITRYTDQRGCRCPPCKRRRRQEQSRLADEALFQQLMRRPPPPIPPRPEVQPAQMNRLAQDMVQLGLYCSFCKSDQHSENHCLQRTRPIASTEGSVQAPHMRIAAPVPPTPPATLTCEQCRESGHTISNCPEDLDVANADMEYRRRTWDQFHQPGEIGRYPPGPRTQTYFYGQGDCTRCQDSHTNLNCPLRKQEKQRKEEAEARRAFAESAAKRRAEAAGLADPAAAATTLSPASKPAHCVQCDSNEHEIENCEFDLDWITADQNERISNNIRANRDGVVTCYLGGIYGRVYEYGQKDCIHCLDHHTNLYCPKRITPEERKLRDEERRQRVMSRTHAEHRAAARDYFDQFNCKRCNGSDHTENTCTKEAVLITKCEICGKNGHSELTCGARRQIRTATALKTIYAKKCMFCAQRDHKSSECRFKARCHHCMSYEHLSRDCPHLVEKWFQYCAYCKKPGHLLDSCLSMQNYPSPAEQLVSSQCLLCKATDHSTKDHPFQAVKTEEAVRIRVEACSICHEEGHTHRTCRLRRSQRRRLPDAEKDKETHRERRKSISSSSRDEASTLTRQTAALTLSTTSQALTSPKPIICPWCREVKTATHFCSECPYCEKWVTGAHTPAVCPAQPMTRPCPRCNQWDAHNWSRCDGKPDRDKSRDWDARR